MKKDFFTLIGGFLTAVLLFLGTIGISFDWFTQESIDSLLVMIAAAVALAVNLNAIWKNTNRSKKAVSEKTLQSQGLMKK